MKKTTVVTFGLLFLITNIFWAYRVFDQGVSMTYLETSNDTNFKSLKAHQAICSTLVKGMSKSRLLELLKRVFPEEEPFEKEGHIHISGVSVKIEQDTTVSMEKACE